MSVGHGAPDWANDRSGIVSANLSAGPGPYATAGQQTKGESRFQTRALSQCPYTKGHYTLRPKLNPQGPH